MAQTLYKLDKSFDGPWLISAESMKRLEEIITSEVKRLEQYREDQIAQEIKESRHEFLFNYGHSYEPEEAKEMITEIESKVRTAWDQLYPTNVSIKIHLSSSKNLQGNSLEQILRAAEIQESRPIGFAFDILCGKVRGTIHLGPRMIYYSSSLSIDVQPESADPAREMFFQLANWAKEAQAPRWQRFWFSIVPWHWAILIIVLYPILTITSENDKSIHRKKAHELIEQGISDRNLYEAVQTVLALTSDYHPRTSVHTSSRFLLLLIGTLVAAIIITIKPRKAIIGYGRGATAIKRWKAYIEFIFYSVPLFIFASLVGPTLFAWLDKWIKLTP